MNTVLQNVIDGDAIRENGKSGTTRLLMVTESLEVGGAENQALQVIQHLPRERYSVEIALLATGGPLEEKVQSLGVPLHRLPRSGFLHLPTMVALAQLLRQGKFDVALGLLHYSSMMVGIAGQMAGTPLRISSNVGDRSLYEDDWPARKQRIVKSLSYALCNRVFVNSHFIEHADPQLRRYDGKVHCIYNGLTEEAFSQPCSRAIARQHFDIDTSAPVVSMMGRLVPSKDYETFLRVIGSLVESHPGLRAMVIGDGPLRDSLVALRNSLKLQDVVLFTGNLQDPRTALSATDIFMFTSRRESLPNAVLEAMAQGLPVVAARTAGVPELIQDGVDGALCDMGSLESFSLRLSELLENDGLRHTWGESARKNARDRFHWNTIISEYEALFTL